MLEHTYEIADYVSIHRYYENFGNDDDFLASFYDMDLFIKTSCATCDYVKAVKRSPIRGLRRRGFWRTITRFWTLLFSEASQSLF